MGNKLKSKDMKFAVFAALVASSSALTGCKKGIQGKVYTDSACKEDSHSSFNLIEKHVSETGKCNTFEATDDDKKALVTAAKDLKAATKVTDAKKVTLDHVDKIEIDDSTVTEDKKVKLQTVAEAFHSDYPDLKKKYMAWIAAQKAYADHKLTFKKPDDLTAVEAYHTAQKAWLYQTMYPEADADDQKAALKDLADTKKAAEDALPKDPAADTAIIDADVSTELNFKKFKVDKIDSVTTLNEDCVSAGYCSVQPIEAITKAYLNADGDYTIAKHNQDEFAKVVKSATETIDQHTYATITTCDAKDGIEHKEYDEASCEGTPVVTFKAQWGACVQAPDAKSFIKVTGAAALQAAAVAVVAFAGSQF